MMQKVQVKKKNTIVFHLIKFNSFSIYLKRNYFKFPTKYLYSLSIKNDYQDYKWSYNKKSKIKHKSLLKSKKKKNKIRTTSPTMNLKFQINLQKIPT